MLCRTFQIFRVVLKMPKVFWMITKLPEGGTLSNFQNNRDLDSLRKCQKRLKTEIGNINSAPDSAKLFNIALIAILLTSHLINFLLVRRWTGKPEFFRNFCDMIIVIFCKLGSYSIATFTQALLVKWAQIVVPLHKTIIFFKKKTKMLFGVKSC